MTIEIIAFLFAVGLFVGFVAGLFGIGGGMVMVPILIYVFDHLAVPIEISGVMAIATSVGCIVFTGMSSARAHFKHNNVEKSVLPHLAIGVALGGVIGALIADYVGGVIILQVFVAFAYFSAYRMFQPHTKIIADTFPKNKLFSIGSGTIIGAVSNIVGIGGGVLSVPLMVMYNIPMRIAIGTSAVLGICLSIPGAMSYALLDTSQPVAGAIGYIHIPAMLALMSGSIFMAPVGARVATQMDTIKLKRYFTILIVIAATNVLWRTISL